MRRKSRIILLINPNFHQLQSSPQSSPLVMSIRHLFSPLLRRFATAGSADDDEEDDDDDGDGQQQKPELNGHAADDRENRRRDPSECFLSSAT